MSSRGVHFSTHTPLLKVLLHLPRGLGLSSLRWSGYFVKKVLLLTRSFHPLLMISVRFSSGYCYVTATETVSICLTGQCKPHLCCSLWFTQPPQFQLEDCSLSPESCLHKSMADTKLGTVALSSQILKIPRDRDSPLLWEACCTDALCS